MIFADVDWTNVIPVWLAQAFWVGVILAWTWYVSRIAVKRQIDAEVRAALNAVGRKMTASDILLTAIEQYLQATKQENTTQQNRLVELITAELKKQATLVTATAKAVVGEVKKAADVTADKIVEKVSAVANPESADGTSLKTVKPPHGEG